MTTRTDSSAAILPDVSGPIFKQTTGVKNKPTLYPQLRVFTPDYFHWDQLTLRLPLVHLLQPDYYKVFRFSSPERPIYQHNLFPEHGQVDFCSGTFLQHIHPCDSLHIQRTDRIIQQFALECHLGSFDFICTMIMRWNGPGNDMRYFLRKTAILQADEKGVPVFGIMTLKDITSIVSAVKPGNIDITFHPERSDLRHELLRRIKSVQPKRQDHFTVRELEIIRCLSKGMSSKEIAGALYISKATVDTHRQNLIHKREVANTAALLKLAMEEGCI